MKLRIAAVQLNPLLGQVEENSKRAIKILEQAFPSNKPKPDIIIFPELALTGYNFTSPQHIKPYLEIAGKGKSYELGKTLAEKYQCLTLLGYPESKEQKIYNSAMLINATGEILKNYRKMHLFETDETWGCSESPDGFQAFDLDIMGEKIRSTIGICMDLNPYQFKAPFESYEFATHCKNEKCRLILVPTAWLDSSWDQNWNDEDAFKFKKIYDKKESIIEINDSSGYAADNKILTHGEQGKDPKNYNLQVPDKSTGRYWIVRFNPLFSSVHEDLKQTVVVCNRSGMEDKLMYAGTSSIFRFNGGTMQKTDEGLVIDFKVFGSLGQGVEGVLVREVDI